MSVLTIASSGMAFSNSRKTWRGTFEGEREEGGRLEVGLLVRHVNIQQNVGYKTLSETKLIQNKVEYETKLNTKFGAQQNFATHTTH